MYDNIGGKIKGLAKTMFIVAAIGAVITGIVLLATVDDYLILYGLLTLVCGPIIAWVGSWILYAFGELVEDVHAMRKKYYPMAEELANREAGEKEKREAVPTAHSVAASTQKVSVEESADNDDDDFIEGVCPNCGEKWSAFFDDTEVICHKCKKKILIS